MEIEEIENRLLEIKDEVSKLAHKTFMNKLPMDIDLLITKLKPFAELEDRIMLTIDELKK